MAGRRSGASAGAIQAATTGGEPKKKVKRTVEERLRVAKASVAKLESEKLAKDAAASGNADVAKALVQFEKVAPFLPDELATSCRDALRERATKVSTASASAEPDTDSTTEQG